MCSGNSTRALTPGGFPHSEILGYKRLHTTPRGLSQCTTSFIGIWRQGIHRALLVAYTHDTENLKFFIHVFALIFVLHVYLLRVRIVLQQLLFSF